MRALGLRQDECYNPLVIIDIHAHIVPPPVKSKREEYMDDPLFRALYSNPRSALATAEDLISSMEESGIDISVAANLAWSGSERCASTNDYIMDSAAASSGRLVGFGTVYLSDHDAALKEVERCARGGMKGIGEMRLERRLFGNEGGTLLNEFISTVIENNLALLLHCSEPVGHEYPGKGDTTPDLVWNLVRRFPKLRLIAAHWGGGLPMYGLMPEVKRTIREVVFDTAASPFLYSPEIYHTVQGILGSGAIAFGTDYPLLRQGRALKEIRDLGLPSEAQNSILSLNASRILGIAP